MFVRGTTVTRPSVTVRSVTLRVSAACCAHGRCDGYWVLLAGVDSVYPGGVGVYIYPGWWYLHIHQGGHIHTRVASLLLQTSL